MVEIDIVDKGIEAIVRVDVRVDSDVMARSITDAGRGLKIATLALRSSYTVNAPSIEEFTTFQEDMATKSNVYKDKVLLLANLFPSESERFHALFQRSLLRRLLGYR